jgi:hypothetical protein
MKTSGNTPNASGRKKARFNAYIPHELVSWGEAHAAIAFKTARKPKGESLSFLIEKLLRKHKASAERKAALRAKLTTNQRRNA